MGWPKTKNDLQRIGANSYQGQEASRKVVVAGRCDRLHRRHHGGRPGGDPPRREIRLRLPPRGHDHRCCPHHRRHGQPQRGAGPGRGRRQHPGHGLGNPHLPAHHGSRHCRRQRGGGGSGAGGAGGDGRGDRARGEDGAMHHCGARRRMRGMRHRVRGPGRRATAGAEARMEVVLRGRGGGGGRDGAARAGRQDAQGAAAPERGRAGGHRLLPHHHLGACCGVDAAPGSIA
mmetsp:Transcript_178599/g.572508  ORF Transcript_178599/g.572508 Transcript_178599/m.572508 type:complete len:231 (-) Transcript_178599:172-864(-)